MIAALEQTWPPFVLVAGLLLIGHVASEDGLFDYAASRLERLPGSPAALFAACCLTVAITTALLNLDTAAVFLTPVLILAARRRGLRQAPFLYGALFMVNASSLYLPGSNLTNLLVGANERSGAAFFVSMLPVSLTATVVTALGLALLHRDALRGRAAEHGVGESGRVASEPDGRAGAPQAPASPPIGLGLFSVVAAAGFILALRNPALPVLAIGLLVAAMRLLQRRVTFEEARRRLGAPALAGLFVLAVSLGALARVSGFPGGDLSSVSAPVTAIVGAVSSVAVNNLPAAAVLSAGHAAHPHALLLGLDVGPNLAVTGSLAALLWWRAARSVDASPSVLECSRQGLLLAPVAIALALVAGAAAGAIS